METTQQKFTKDVFDWVQQRESAQHYTYPGLYAPHPLLNVKPCIVFAVSKTECVVVEGTAKYGPIMGFNAACWVPAEGKKLVIVDKELNAAI